MKKEIYVVPSIDYMEFVPESSILTSSNEGAEVEGVTPDPWEKGNENWW